MPHPSQRPVNCSVLQYVFLGFLGDFPGREWGGISAELSVLSAAEGLVVFVFVEGLGLGLGLGLGGSMDVDGFGVVGCVFVDGVGCWGFGGVIGVSGGLVGGSIVDIGCAAEDMTA